MSDSDIMFIRGVPYAYLKDEFSKRFSARWSAETEPARVSLQNAGDCVVFGGASSCPPAEVVMGKIVAEAGGSTLTLRWQDGDSWQITLEERGVVVADFNSNPECYYEEPNQEAAFAAGRTIAARWGIPEDRIINYFRYFDEFDLANRAYSDDESPAGSADQLWDFMRAAHLDNADRSAYPVECLTFKPKIRLGRLARFFTK